MATSLAQGVRADVIRARLFEQLDLGAKGRGAYRVGAEFLPARRGEGYRQRMRFGCAGAEDKGNGDGPFAQMIGEDALRARGVGFVQLVIQLVRQCPGFDSDQQQRQEIADQPGPRFHEGVPHVLIFFFQSNW